MSFLTDGKGLPIDDPGSGAWFHGSPTQLTTLAAGSAVTRNRRLAEAFSHKPRILQVADDGSITHDGVLDGFLYQVDEPVCDGDVEIHPGIPQRDPWEWTTKRDLKLKLITRITVGGAPSTH